MIIIVNRAADFTIGAPVRPPFPPNVAKGWRVNFFRIWQSYTFKSALRPMI
jgi:hypothetical protein